MKPPKKPNLFKQLIKYAPFGVIGVYLFITCAFQLLGYELNIFNLKNYGKLYETSSDLLPFFTYIGLFAIVFCFLIPIIFKAYFHFIVKPLFDSYANKISDEGKGEFVEFMSGWLASIFHKFIIRMGYMSSDNFKDDFSNIEVKESEKIDFANMILKDSVLFWSGIHLIITTIFIFNLNYTVLFVFIYLLTLLLMKQIFFLIIIIAFHPQIIAKAHSMVKKKLQS